MVCNTDFTSSNQFHKMTVNAFNGHNSTKGHSGLQALQVIGSSVRSFLGPLKSVKCVLDGDSSEGDLVSTTNELLQKLDIEHPVGQLVRETCSSQNKVHGTGCSTVVTLAGLWAGQVQILLDKGVPIDEIIKNGDVFISECLKIVDKNVIPLHFSPPQPDAEVFKKSRRTTHTGITPSVDSSKHPAHRINGNKGGTRNFSVPRRPCDTSFNPGNPNYNSNNGNVDHFSNSMTLNAIHVPDGNFSRWSDLPVTLCSSADDDAAEQCIDEDLSWYFRTADDSNSPGVKSLSGGHQQLQDDELFCIEAQGSSNSDSSTTRHSDDGVGGMQSKCKKQAGGGTSRSVDAAATNLSRLQTSGERDAELHHTNDKDLRGGAHCFLNPRQDHKETDKEGVSVNFPSRDGNSGLPMLRGGETCAAGNYGNSMDQGKCLHDGKPGESANGVATTQSGTASGKQKSQLQHLSAMLHEVHSIAKRPTRDSCTSSFLSFPTVRQEVDEKTKRSHSSTGDIGGMFLSLGTKVTPLSNPQEQGAPKLQASRSHGRILSRHLLADDSGLIPATDTEVMAERGVSAVSPHKLQAGRGVSGHRTDNDILDGRRRGMGSVEKVGQISISSLQELSHGLSHGAEVEMKLALEVCHKQLSLDPQFFRGEFDRDRVHVQTLVGPPSSASDIVDGLIVPLSEDQIQKLQSLEGKNLQALLVNGDISASYRHRGFKKSLKTTTVSTSAHLRDDSEDSMWAENVFSCLDKLGVDVLIVRGLVDVSFLDDGRLQQRLVLEHVPYRVLQMLAAVSKSTVLTYVTDALQDDVCRSLKVTYWMPGFNHRQILRSSAPSIKHHVRLMTPSGLMTAVVCGLSEPLLIGATQRFTACMARLRGALRDGRVLPGRGHIEEIVTRHFCDEVTRNGFQCHSSWQLVCSILSEGLSQYTAQIRINQGLEPGMHSPARQQEDGDDEEGDGSECPTYDCMAAKTGAWKRAWHLLGQVLCADALIITGVCKGDGHLAAEL